MASIIDPTPEEAGNPERALEALNTSTSTTTTTEKTEDRYKIPDKFVGKSLEEVLTSYQQLESAYGRTKQELSQARMSTDQLLQQKRENDLRANGATTVTQQTRQAPELTAADLLENPTEALNSYLENRESATTQALRQEQAVLRQQLQQQQFIGKHPEWQKETNDPGFVEWARQTPFRQNLAARAAQEDLDAADALLTEFKAYKPLLTRTTSQSTNLEAARRVGLERSAASGDEAKPTGKVIRRADSQALMLQNPDKYYSDAYQQELIKAIAEDRYK